MTNTSRARRRSIWRWAAWLSCLRWRRRRTPPGPRVGRRLPGWRRLGRGGAHRRRADEQDPGRTIVVNNKPGACDQHRCRLRGQVARCRQHHVHRRLRDLAANPALFAVAVQRRDRLRAGGPAGALPVAGRAAERAGEQPQGVHGLGAGAEGRRQLPPPAPAARTTWPWNCSASAPGRSCSTCPPRRGAGGAGPGRRPDSVRRDGQRAAVQQ